ncbi:MAG: heat-inducible transcriptional repressor HrcA [Lachnospiraceae bacterium]|nr:heat-inducible transcriptional repressor HrcA [Lachnospiraceae bacterium]
MELDGRKKVILKTIIQNYLETGEPVGSRTISKCSDLKLSSATIRNEMSDLEEMGYILQPHTSSGRIPSDKGYRLYVDELIREKDQEVADIKELMIQKTDRLEHVLKHVVKVLASNTNYATMITGPTYHQNRLKFIQLSKVSEKQLLAVIVTEGNLMKNQFLEIDEPIDDDQLLKLNLLLNTQLNGLTIGEINLDMIRNMKLQAGIHSSVVGSVVDAVADAIQPDEEDRPVFTSGATNIFKYPELSDSATASELINALEEKKELVEILKGSGLEADDSPGTGIQVYIGNESPNAKLKDCSMVTASYDLGGGLKGTIGILGPKRMDYENVVDNLKMLKVQLDKIFGDEKNKTVQDVSITIDAITQPTPEEEE